MNTLSLLLFSSVFVVFLFFILPGLVTGSRKKKKLQTIREQWGKQVLDVYRNPYLLQQFSKYSQETGGLSAQTLLDIDFDELFTFLDRTNSCVGQQYFYHKLKYPLTDETALKELDEQVNFFTDNTGTREEIQLLLTPLQKQDAYYISSLLQENLFPKPKWHWLLKVDTAIVIIMLVLSVKFHVLLIWMLAPFALNIFLHLWNKNNASHFSQSLPQLSRLIDIAGVISAKKIPFNKETARQSIQELNGFKKRYRFLAFKSGSLDEASQALLIGFELIKALFLIEVHSFINCIDEIQNNKRGIINLFSYIGSIDMAITVASIRKGNPGYCKPVFSAHSKQMTLEKVYHPLIEDCVTNTLSVHSKSILITGSNMSGKTTFIRTVAINSILAQTIYTCFAEKFSSPPLRVLSSIRIDDNLLEGKSFYLAEVETIHELLNASDTSEQYLFVLDEVFKGTNTIERIAAAKAILSYLNRKNHIVLVSTHDLELADLLQTEYDLYHFEEQVADNELFFDHLIKEGRLTKRNAIKLLEISGYPESVLTEARQIANTSINPR